jgi:hypothetical protein
MRGLVLRTIATLLVALAGYVPIQAFLSYAYGFRDPVMMVTYPESLNLAFRIALAGAWAVVLMASCRLTAAEARRHLLRRREARDLDSKRKSVENLKAVAETEFMKRRISQETFNEIERMCEKQLVEIKSRARELGAPRRQDKAASNPDK